MIVRLLPLQTDKAKGNTIIEYSLIGVLVVTVAIVSMFVFGRNFNEHLTNMDTGVEAHVARASFIEAQAQAAVAGAAFSIGPGTQSLGNTSASQDGLAQTTGANGDTLNTGLNGTTDSTDTSDAEAPTSEDQLKSLLQDLANDAHRIAYLQSLIENIVKYADGDNHILQTSTIYYDGMIVNAYQLSHALSNGGEIIALDEKKQRVMESTVASAEVKEAIASLTEQIKDSALSTSTLSDSTPSSDETHKDAGKICATGGSLDTGSECLPYSDAVGKLN